MSSIEKDTRTRILEATWQLLEAEPGRRLSMSAIAKASGVSRQALYLHFSSRAELLIATTRYVDEVKGLDQRLAKVQQCTTAIEMLKVFVQEWGDYIPEVYGVAKALMMTKEADEAAAQAWSEIMGCLYAICVDIVRKLTEENKCSMAWDEKSAADFLWTVMSIHNWEQLVRDCDWDNERFVSFVTQSIISTLVNE